MALVKCSDCNKDVSTSAQSCPHCGAPVRLPVFQKQDSAQNGGCLGLIIAVVGLGCLISVVQGAMDGCNERDQKAEAVRQLEVVKETPEPIIAGARASLERGDLAGAKAAMDKLNQAGVKHDLEPAYKAKVLEKRAEQEALAEAQRASAVQAALASTSKGCDAWEEDWDKLRLIKAQEVTSDAKKMVARLEKCRVKAIKEREKIARAVAIGMRENIKDKLDGVFLSDGLDVRLKTTGADHTTIRLSNILFDNRVIIKKLTDAGLLKILEGAGFKKAIFAGYDSSTTYELTPAGFDHKEDNLAYWKEKQLHLPLALPSEAAP